MIVPTQVTLGAVYVPRKPALNFRYRAFVRSFSCVACGSLRYIEAAHTGPRGLGQKANDMDCIPLCAKCHRIKVKSFHALGAVRFFEFHGLLISEIIEFLQSEWAKLLLKAGI